MKNTLLFSLLFSCILSTISAQDLSDFALIAHYPLTNNSAADATGSYGDMELTNAPFQGSEGVYSNGVYIYSAQPNGCLISTPALNFPDTSNIAFSLEFKAEDTGFSPIIVAGDLYRWLGAFVVSGELQLLVSDALYNTGQTIQSGQWYTLTVAYRQGETKIYLNDQLALTHNSGPLNYHLNIEGDRKISNTHGGFGYAFKGNWRNLKIYSKGNVSNANQHAKREIGSLDAWPIPAQRNLFIKLPPAAPLHNPMNIRLMDANGRLCFEVSKTFKQTVIPLTLSPLPPGMYYLQISSTSGQTWQKPILLK